jgi:hypothetical protein
MSKIIGALWIRESRDSGKQFFSGQLDLGALGTIHIAIFRNDRRQNDRQPEFNIVLSQPVPPQPPETVDSPVEEPNDNIPF